MPEAGVLGRRSPEVGPHETSGRTDTTAQAVAANGARKRENIVRIRINDARTG